MVRTWNHEDMDDLGFYEAESMKDKASEACKHEMKHASMKA